VEGDFEAPEGCIVFDLELTAWEGSMARGWSGPGEHREVIQIGAVRLGPAPALDERGAFSVLVRPVLNPVLSEYIVALTGITQAMVDAAGLGFAEAVARFDTFVGGPQPVFCNGGDHDILAENAGWHGLPPSAHSPRMRNIRRWLGARLGVGDTAFHSIDVAHLAGGTAQTDRRHDALADARTIAAGLRLLLR
jgi:inhibitor of KinA sporulation pathway (predicted exonuclease)